MLDPAHDRIRNEHRRLGPNERRVLDVIRHHAPISRTDVSKVTGLSAATIGRIAGRLLLDDVLVETGKIISGLGRPSILLEVNAARGAVIAIELDGDHVIAAVADLTGHIVWHESNEQQGSTEDTYRAIIDALNGAREEATSLGMPIAALTIGIPAIIDQRRGLALAGPRVQWTEFEIIKHLEREIDIPLIVDNDVNLAAIGHHWCGDAIANENFAIFTIGAGTGGAVVAGGRLVRGHRNAAGEFGYIVTDSRDVFQQPELAGGSLEEIVSDSGIVRLAKNALAESNGASSLDANTLSRASQVIDAASAGDAIALVVMDQVARHLAVAVIGVATVVAPEAIIIDGSVGRKLDPFLDGLREAVQRRVPNPPRVQVAEKASQATLHGAIAVGLDLAWSTQLPERIQAPEAALIG